MKNKLNIFLLFFVAFSMACTSAPQKESPTESKIQSPTAATPSAQNQTPDQTASPVNSPVVSQTAPVKGSASAPQVAGKTDSAEIEAKPTEVIIADFNAIETGMTYADVVKILGSNGEKSGDYKTENGSMQLYKWAGKNSNGEWVLSARFDNGKLTNKSQFGLK